MAAYVRVKNIIIVFSCAEANRYNGFCQDVFFGRAMCEGVECGGACRGAGIGVSVQRCGLGGWSRGGGGRMGRQRFFL